VLDTCERTKIIKIGSNDQFDVGPMRKKKELKVRTDLD